MHFIIIFRHRKIEQIIVSVLMELQIVWTVAVMSRATGNTVTHMFTLEVHASFSFIRCYLVALDGEHADFTPTSCVHRVLISTHPHKENGKS